MKLILFYTIILILTACDSPQTYLCYSGQTMDDCGNCRECESEECGWNDAMDDCGECYGDNTSCIECTDPLASNYSSSEECEYNNPGLWIIDLAFLTEDNYCISNNDSGECAQYNNENSCNLFADDYGCSWIGTFEFYTNTPIYWNNTSNQDITIYTINTEGDYCDFTFESIDNNCDQISNQINCESEGCNWVLSPTYNPYWDQYTETIPQGLAGIQHSYFFLGCEPNQGECGAFNHITEEIFCANISNEEKCGIIKVIN